MELERRAKLGVLDPSDIEGKGSMEKPLDVYLSDLWNETMAGHDRCRPETMWEVCRVLVNHGWATANEESVAMLEIGPFKLAGNPEVEAFVSVIITAVIPSVLKTFASGMSPAAAAGSILVPLFALAKAVGEAAVKVPDALCWNVLLWVRQENERGYQPTIEDVATELASRDGTITQLDVENAVRELEDASSIIGDKHIVLISQHLNGRLESRV